MSSSLAGITEALIGQNMNAHPDCLGIYIGIDEMYVAQTTKKDSGTVLESLVRVPINSVNKTLLKPLDLNEPRGYQFGFFILLTAPLCDSGRH